MNNIICRAKLFRFKPERKQHNLWVLVKKGQGGSWKLSAARSGKDGPQGRRQEEEGLSHTLEVAQENQQQSSREGEAVNFTNRPRPKLLFNDSTQLRY